MTDSKTQALMEQLREALTASCKDIPPEFAAIVDREFWNLLKPEAALIAADAQELAKAKAALQFMYEECRAPVRDYLNALERQLLRCDDGTYPSHYRPLLEKEATRYRRLLDEIDAALDAAIAARGEGEK